MNQKKSLKADGFHIPGFNSSRPFSSFLPGIAGESGKPLWVFYTNRGQCISSFGIRDKNGAMLEFHAANKAYALTSTLGFRTFIKLESPSGATLYEPFQMGGVDPVEGLTQRLIIRPEEIEIEEVNALLGLRIRVLYFTLPNENLPALVRHVTVENIGAQAIQATVIDGLPQVVPFGLEEKLLKHLSRTMEAFAEIRHVKESLPFFKLKVEPSDKPEMERIEGGFFAFTLCQGQTVPVVVDPDLVFGTDTSMRTPLALMHQAAIDPTQARCETMTGSAFAQLALKLSPGKVTEWDSFFGQVPDWSLARDFRARVMADALYTSKRRGENTQMVSNLSAQFALIAGPQQLDPYSRQAFLDNTLRGGQPVVINGPLGARVFHTFTRKHGDMERDYNAFEVAPTYWSQGNGNFRDVNQNRRCENFVFSGIDATNIETFFNLIQLDGNNPLVIQSEKFHVPPVRLEPLWENWHAGNTAEWRALLAKPFSPGQLMDALMVDYGTPEMARPWFDQILGLSDKVQDAQHGEGFWVDHWIYNLDLLESYAALYPDRLHHLLLERPEFTYFDNDHRVQPRSKKYALRPDGAVRQLHSVVRDHEKSELIAVRTQSPHAMRTGQGHGDIYRTTLLAKMVNLMAVKASLLDPFGVGLEMEAEKPGWCDALNGLPGLVGSSTHEAFALARWVLFVRTAVQSLQGSEPNLLLPTEVAEFVNSVTNALAAADADDFFPTWDQLAAQREAFREKIRFGLAGTQITLLHAELLRFLSVVEHALQVGLAKAVNADGLPISYFINEVTDYEVLVPEPHAALLDEDAPVAVHVRARAFRQKPVSAFLEGSVHALRLTSNAMSARTLYASVRQSKLFDHKLGMYCVNTPLTNESFEIGRSKIFSPGWLENESIFLHMHYKFLLETLRSGLAEEFFEDIKRGLVAFQNPEVYGRSPLENSSFITSSRFPDAKVHGVGFVARLSGATAEWISMVLHMGLGPHPFQMVDGELRFVPQPCLADWLFTSQSTGGFAADSFGFKLFGHTWVVYHNPQRSNTYGETPVAPVAFELHYTDGRRIAHPGNFLPAGLSLDLRNGLLNSLVIKLA
jgi:hypothetical protein